MTEAILKKSIVVAAHPDDEILWFSSIITDVDEVLTCFLSCASQPHWGPGRQKSLSHHPVQKVNCLNLEEAEVFQGADWENPCLTNYGLEIVRRNVSDSRYRENYHALRHALEERLKGFDNVFTHNPWGDYGNEEHIQIYRVIRELQDRMKFNLWFSNYASNVSFPLMLQYISGCTSDYVTRRTNKTIGTVMMDIYKEHNCWTWFDDWEWFNEESFMKDKDLQAEKKDHGHIFPINIIKFNYPGMPKEETKKEYVRIAQLRRFIGSLLDKAGLRRS